MAVQEALTFRGPSATAVPFQHETKQHHGFQAGSYNAEAVQDGHFGVAELGVRGVYGINGGTE